MNYTGINIQYPISQKIISGEKSIETRTYPLPKKYEGVPMALVETPGTRGSFKSRIVGLITFSRSFLYNSSEDFYDDIERHCVDRSSDWKWNDDKPKWGWVIDRVQCFEEPIPMPKRSGIVYTTDIELPL